MSSYDENMDLIGPGTVHTCLALFILYFTIHFPLQFPTIFNSFFYFTSKNKIRCYRKTASQHMLVKTRLGDDQG